MMKVPNEPSVRPNNGVEKAFLSDESTASSPREGQANRPGAKTTSLNGIAHVCHSARQE